MMCHFAKKICKGRIFFSRNYVFIIAEEVKYIFGITTNKRIYKNIFLIQISVASYCNNKHSIRVRNILY